MVETDNELEWRRHLIAAIDSLGKKVDENSAEHILIRAEIAAVKLDVTTVKALNPDKKINDWIESSRGWRMVIVGQMVAILMVIASCIWWSATMNTIVYQLKANQIQLMQDVDDLKMTSIGYREFRIKEISDKKEVTKHG